MDFMEILSIYRNTISAVLVLLILVITLIRFWDKISFWWLNFSYWGWKIDGLKKDRNSNDGWFKAERTLCQDYFEKLKIKNESDYNKCQAYLNKAGDIGRKPFPVLMWPLIIALVFIEAWGFSLVLADFAVPGVSANLQKEVALGLAFMISALLLLSTHFAGHELYKSNQQKHARESWDENGKKENLGEKLITFSADQSVDDDQPGYIQLANRVGHRPSYVITKGTLIFIIVVAIGATYVRGQALEKELQSETTGQAQSSFGDPGNLSSGPSELTQPQINAEKKVIDEGKSTTRKAGWGTFVILGVVFTFLQLLGIFFGWNWGFAGKESAKAYRISGNGKFDTYDELKAHYFDRVADAAQSNLESLQQKIQVKNSEKSTVGLKMTKTFLDFVAEKTQKHEPSQSNHAKNVQSLPNPIAAQNIVRVDQQPNEKLPALEIFQGYSDKQSNRVSKVVTLSDLDELARNGTVDDSCYVLKGKEWIKYGAIRVPELPDDMPPLPDDMPPLPNGA